MDAIVRFSDPIHDQVGTQCDSNCSSMEHMQLPLGLQEGIICCIIVELIIIQAHS